ncbi:NAD(P)H-dependent glycerol-3-phosphate dehydrogenase [Ideonella sp. A 288]|uniref:NAD(P)H-dependent glycerol-3-phosphate dehydrogenase n=1 Tax=Ideonella sp. A 288 TaxID=1962181 RepID=UPI000B4B7908|nr:NAD(P)H-dependent glycerol-3-phosphate dehydrogenase [Ideonella sp. A 288]
MRIAVLGAGAWGTALAIAAAPRHGLMLWGRDADQVEAMRRGGVNERYLPEVALPASLTLTADLAEALAWGEGGLLVVATPMAGLRALLAVMPAHTPACWLCKGFEAGSGALGHEIARELRPGAANGVLSGPSFALEVAQGRPTALVAASDDADLATRMVQAFHGPVVRVYSSADPVGVEVGGAVKNVMAIATGIADGLSLGQNARAALVTRGLAEMTRLATALGAQPSTLMGLSGLGDLVLTATGDLSRNRRVGLMLATGLALPAILERLGHVAEGVYSAPTVLQRARALGVEMPITEAVMSVLDGRSSPGQALQALMARESRSEID